MHLRAFFIFAFITSSFCVVAQENDDVLARKVSLNFRNTSIEEILRDIETEDFAFTYSAEVFDVKKRVTISVKEESLGSVLEKLFSGQNMECEQLGNKLLIRKKRTLRVLPPKTDLVKTKNQSSETIDSINMKQASSQAQTSAVSKKVIKKPVSEISSSSVKSVEDKVTVEEREVAAYYAMERRRTAAFVTKYANYQKPPLNFMPIYLTEPKVFIPIQLSFNEPIKVEESKEEEKGEKNARERKKFRMHITPNIGYTKIQDRDAILIGGELVYHTNQTFGFGFVGKGFLSRREMDLVLDNTFGYSGGYGGLLFETTFFPNSPVHLTTSVMFGGGTVLYGQLNTVSSTITEIEDEKMFFVLEPSANLEFNVFKYMRVGFGASYRDTSSADLKYQSSGEVILGGKDFEGLSFNAFIKLGIF